MMKKTTLLWTSLLCMALPVFAQQKDINSYIPAEKADPHPAPVEAWNSVKSMALGWGSIDERYGKHEALQCDEKGTLSILRALQKSLTLQAWRGERVQAQAVLLCPKGLKSLAVTMSDLTSGKNRIAAEQVERFLVRYTMADLHDKDVDSCLVADGLLPLGNSGFCILNSALENTTQPLWLDIKVPQETKAGRYKGTLTVVADGQAFTLPLTLNVSDRVLPPPSQWAFHLDLWQNPYAAARYYNVPLWSEEHFRLMRPTMELLASAGQKVITCSIFQRPWNGQTEDAFESMIGKTFTLDGQWKYDYRVFDRWVEFMTSCGITEQIDCYTVLPWHLIFEYYDEARNATVLQHLQPGSKEYEAYLMPFLKDFARHLRQKGWMEKTCIAMDERPKELLEPAYQIIHAADPDYRIEGAINYFGPEVAERMYDVSFFYCEPLLEKAQLESHLTKNRRITIYTCCGPFRPNTFTFSPPAESVYMGWHAAAAGYSGYLRWAYNSWVKSPWEDSRFRTWLSGDCFLVYPGGSSIRMQRLIEGIQDYEKIRILRRDLPAKKLTKLNQVIEKFAPVEVPLDFDINDLMREAKAALDEL